MRCQRYCWLETALAGDNNAGTPSTRWLGIRVPAYNDSSKALASLGAPGLAARFVRFAHSSALRATRESPAGSARPSVSPCLRRPGTAERGSPFQSARHCNRTADLPFPGSLGFALAPGHGGAVRKRVPRCSRGTGEVWGHNKAVAVAWRTERANHARVERSEWSRLSDHYPTRPQGARICRSATASSERA